MPCCSKPLFLWLWGRAESWSSSDAVYCFCTSLVLPMSFSLAVVSVPAAQVKESCLELSLQKWAKSIPATGQVSSLASCDCYSSLWKCKLLARVIANEPVIYADTPIFPRLWPRPCLHPKKLCWMISKPDVHECNPYLCENFHKPKFFASITLVASLMSVDV